jgi:hypothetical protein
MELVSYQRNRIWARGLDASGSEQSPETRSCDHGNELSGSMKGGAFTDKLFKGLGCRIHGVIYHTK